MREQPEGFHKWTMWQAPQISMREHWVAPLPSRIWTYISSMYECGGVSGLQHGGFHMVFSGYSLPLALAMNAQSWDGDIIAEDHHCYIKNFFYSVHSAAEKALSSSDGGTVDCQPLVTVKPVFLPVKSTPVISAQGYWMTYVERWHQAKRHAQGIAELSFALLATFDLFCTLPLRAYSFSLLFGLGKVLTRLMCMHLLPLCQGVGLATMTVYWLFQKTHISECPEYLTFAFIGRSEYLLCGFAGAWALTWPMIIPIAAVIVENYCFAISAFKTPGEKDRKISTVWHSEDGGFPAVLGSKRLAIFGLIAVDSAVFMAVMMVPYGFLAMLVAMFNVAIWGNSFTYVTASKLTRASAEASTNYGSMA